MKAENIRGEAAYEHWKFYWNSALYILKDLIEGNISPVVGNRITIR